MDIFTAALDIGDYILYFRKGFTEIKSRIKEIIITGSSGTIGTALCERLLKYGYNIQGVDVRHNTWDDQIERLTAIHDLRKKKVVKLLPDRSDLIIHLAANARVYDLVKKPNHAMDNFLMTFNVLEYARSRKIKRIIFASSREVYGNGKDARKKETELSISSCKSPYAATKLGGETLVNSYFHSYGISPVILRFSNVYGKYDISNRVIPIFIKRALQNKDLTIFGEKKVLDFTYIDDCVDGIVNVIDNFDTAKGNVFNIGTGTGISIMSLAQIVKQKTASHSRMVIKESRTGEVIRFIADIDNARKKLGYQPTMTIDEGIERSIAWYKSINQ